MTEEQREILSRIQTFADEVLKDIDPQKTQVSYQLEKLKPVMEEISAEKGMTLEDVFILYLDLAGEAAIEMERKLQDGLADLQV